MSKTKKENLTYWKPKKLGDTVSGRFINFSKGQFNYSIRLNNTVINLNHDLEQKIGMIKKELVKDKSVIVIKYTGILDTGQLNKMRTFEVKFNDKLIESANFNEVTADELPF